MFIREGFFWKNNTYKLVTYPYKIKIIGANYGQI